MAEHLVKIVRNPDKVLITRPSKDVEVTVVINVHKDAPDDVILRNAAEALYYVGNTKSWKSWCSKIQTKILKVMT